MLSNYVNAGITDVGLIVHESYQSLLDHVGSGKDWELSRKHGGLRILPPFGYVGKGGGEYRGSMEALSGVYSYLQNIRQDYVIWPGATWRSTCLWPRSSSSTWTPALTSPWCAPPTTADLGQLRVCHPGPDGQVNDLAITPPPAWAWSP